MLHRISPIAFLAMGALLLAACGHGTTQMVTGQEPAVGANANVNVQQSPAGNRIVNLDVQWLPPPDRLEPNANSFAVWILPENAPPQPAGLLEYDEGDRRGRLSITTPYDRFRIIVTPHDRFAPLDRPSDVVLIEHEVMG